MRWYNRCALLTIALSIALLLGPPHSEYEWDGIVWRMVWALYRDGVVWCLGLILALCLALIAVLPYNGQNGDKK
jgi:hypothetical protein